MPLSTGQILNNRYRIVKLLGQGGFGAVYKAWDTNLNGPCALKENKETSPVAQAQFQREASMLFNLRHPNLPKVFDSFIITGQGQYLVMEYIEGQDLAEKLEQAKAPLPEAETLGWVRQVCDALQYLHEQKPPVIHRDLKPANIRITPQGQAVLVDFGIAKVYDPSLRTTVGARAMTPGYSPTEQYLSQGRTDARSDVYALGATLYNLLTNQVPPEAPERNMGVELPSLRSTNPAVSAHIEAAVQTALQMLPEKRFQSMADFKAALAAPQGALVSKPIPATQVTPYQPSPASPTAVRADGVRPGMPSPPGQPSAGTIALPARLPWGWITGAGVLLVVGALLVGGLLRALGNWRESLTVITAAAETQARMTELAAGLEPTLPVTPAVAPTEISRPTSTLPPTERPRPTATHTPEGLPSTITDDKGVVMNLVPAGSFMMGSESGDGDEKPVHEVYLDAFYIDVYEVTNGLYAACVRAGVCSVPGSSKSSTRDSYYGNSQYAQYPVIYVSWNDAVKFCEWRGARLPTEAEWEKAARGGLEGKKYPWGDEAPVCRKGAMNGAKFDDDGDCNDTDTEPVGSYSPNGYGLYDMAGNVWEWVQDWYDSSYYGSQSTWNNPKGPSSGQYRVLRGGGWIDLSYGLRSADRTRSAPGDRHVRRGIRCGGSAPGP
jgi:formylglycine-generating enzyme required for sulfatase activity/predicted Ser/Thr protein kinase